MFDIEELLSDGKFDHRPSDFVRQLSTFQHIPKESYPLFLETYALVDATEGKVRGLMKRLDAMLEMLS
jgi:hypothetical protein